jgi:CIC family chloride channel protein
MTADSSNKTTPDQARPLAVLPRAFLVGILCGLGFGFVMAIVSNGFVMGVEWLTSLRESRFAVPVQIGSLSMSAGPLIGLLCAAGMLILIKSVFGIARWHGPADAIHAAHRSDNELDVRSGFGSTLAAFMSAGGGASVGQYGPLVHFGATMGSFLRQMTGGILSTDIFIGCGVAGAIAAGFNAPIAGIIFAHEAILRHFSIRAIGPIAIASVASVWFSERFFGSRQLFDFASVSINLGEMLPAALLTGPVFGLVAVLFMMAIRHSARFAARSGWSFTRLVMTAAVITGCAGMFVPEVLGLGTETVGDILNGGPALSFLITVLILKLLLTALCIGFGMFGGVFSPALFVGAAAGGIAGSVMITLFGFGSQTALAICGMAAVASAVIGAPVAGVLIILEMTMNYEFALVAMVSVVVAIMVTNVLFGHSFFDRQLLDRGIDIAQGRGHIEMTEMPVTSVIRTDFVRIGQRDTIADALMLFRNGSATEGYIVDENGGFTGKVSLHALIGLSTRAVASETADAEPISIKHDASLLQAIEVASNFVGESLPVINRDTGHLLGVVTEADLFSLYLGLQNRVADLERS